MKISVAVPTYNRGHFITETIDSLLAQSIAVDEIVIVDDGSTDGTEQIIAVYGEKVQYSKIVNSGPAAARAAAIANCNGDWIALCDSDDLWEPNHIENFVTFCQITPTADIYFANFGILDQPGSNKFEELSQSWWATIVQRSSENGNFHLLNHDTYLAFLEFQPIFPSALIFKRKLYNDIGGTSTSVSRINSEDAHLIRRLVAHGVTGCSDEITVQIRKHADNFSKDYVKNIAGKIMVLENIVNNALVSPTYVEATKKQIELSKVQLFRNQYWAGDFLNAKAVFVKTDKKLISLLDWLMYFKCVVVSLIK